MDHLTDIIDFANDVAALKKENLEYDMRIWLDVLMIISISGVPFIICCSCSCIHQQRRDVFVKRIQSFLDLKPLSTTWKRRNDRGESMVFGWTWARFSLKNRLEHHTANYMKATMMRYCDVSSDLIRSHFHLHVTAFLRDNSGQADDASVTRSIALKRKAEPLWWLCYCSSTCRCRISYQQQDITDPI